jgi:hypothetical protein
VALTWVRALSEILALSSLAVSASSLYVSSPSLARRSSTTIANGLATVGPEDEGGNGLHKAYEDKSATHQVNISTYYEGWLKPYLPEACVR